MSIVDYLELLDASTRLVRPDKTGYTPGDVAPIFQRLNLDPDYWKMQIKDFGRLFANVAGKPKDVYEMRSLISKRRFYLKRLKPEPVPQMECFGRCFQVSLRESSHAECEMESCHPNKPRRFTMTGFRLVSQRFNATQGVLSFTGSNGVR